MCGLVFGMYGMAVWKVGGGVVGCCVSGAVWCGGRGCCGVLCGCCCCVCVGCSWEVCLVLCPGGCVVGEGCESWVVGVWFWLGGSEVEILLWWVG